jgi:hypothetical protein
MYQQNMKVKYDELKHLTDQRSRASVQLCGSFLRAWRSSAVRRRRWTCFVSHLTGAIRATERTERDLALQLNYKDILSVEFSET